MWKHNHLDDVQKDLLEKNIIVIGGEIDPDMAMYVREALLRLICKGSPPIRFFITSSGGSVDIGLDIYDALRYYDGEVTGIVQGFAHSICAVILQACKKRLAMRHSRILIHHISRKELSLDVMQNGEKLAEILADLNASQEMIYNIFSERTGHTTDEIKAKCINNEPMIAGEALAFKLIDGII